MPLTRYRAVVLLAAAAAGLAGPGTAVAKTPSGVLVISTENGSGYADVTVSREIRVAPMMLANGVHPTGWSWRGCGRLRGFLLRPLRGNPMAGAGAVDFAELRYGPATDLPLPGGPIPRAPVPLGAGQLDVGDGQAPVETDETVLRPGRYRAFVLGEGRCEVRVPVKGRPGTWRVRATTRAALRFEVKPVGENVTPAVPLARAGAVSTPLPIGPNTLAFSLLHLVSYRTANGTVVPSGATAFGLCVEPDAGPVCSETAGLRPPGRHGFYHRGGSGTPPHVTTPAGSLGYPIAISSFDLAAWYAPGWLPSGEAYAKVLSVSWPATAQQAVAFALDL